MPSPIFQSIAPNPRDVAGLSVRRLLPARKRRMIGPFIFFDHMGPARFDPGTGVDVPPHPHIGLATVTYLFEGSLIHRDSLGAVQAIEPGDVNWMSAGAGIVHSERTGAETRAKAHAIHGLQCWVALPRDAERSAPTFAHTPAADLPVIADRGRHITLVAGSALGRTSPVEIASPLYYCDAVLQAGAWLDLPAEHDEHAIYLIEGAASLNGAPISPLALAWSTHPGPLRLEAMAASRLIAFGGAPLGPRHIWWNFVASDRRLIEDAKQAWRDGVFEPVPGENGFVPLPDR